MLKENFISALATVNRNCPLQLWDDFFPQMELTLNLLQFSQRDQTKSANKEVNGKFDYNKTPLAPLGTKGLVYNDPVTCASWALHGTDAYYVGPALKHYCCLKIYMPDTRGYWLTNMWQLYPMHCAVPTLSPAERTILEALDTLTGGTVPTPTSASMTQRQAIQKLRDILYPIFHQGTLNSVPTDMPSPRVLRPGSPTTP
jgi:hypothetical protein